MAPWTETPGSETRGAGAPPSTNGTPSTAYLDRARQLAERVQASLETNVRHDALYATLASSPATETFAASPAALRHTSEDSADEGDARSDANARRVPESAESATRGDAANAASSTRRDAGDARESERATSARTPRARLPDIARPEE